MTECQSHVLKSKILIFSKCGDICLLVYFLCIEINIEHLIEKVTNKGVMVQGWLQSEFVCYTTFIYKENILPDVCWTVS